MLSEPRLARVGLSRPLRQPLLPAATLYRRGSRSSRLRDQVAWLGRGGNGCGAAVGGSTGASSAGRWGEVRAPPFRGCCCLACRNRGLADS